MSRVIIFSSEARHTKLALKSCQHINALLLHVSVQVSLIFITFVAFGAREPDRLVQRIIHFVLYYARESRDYFPSIANHNMLVEVAVVHGGYFQT